MKLLQLLLRVLAERADGRRRSRKRNIATVNAPVVMSDMTLETRVLLSADSAAAVAVSEAADIAPTIDAVESSSESATVDSLTPLETPRESSATPASDRYKSGGLAVHDDSLADVVDGGISIGNASSTAVNVISAWQDVVTFDDELPILTQPTSLHGTSSLLDDSSGVPQNFEPPTISDSLSPFPASAAERLSISIASADATSNSPSSTTTQSDSTDSETGDASRPVHHERTSPAANSTAENQVATSNAAGFPAVAVKQSDSAVGPTVKLKTQFASRLASHFRSLPNLPGSGVFEYGFEQPESEFNPLDSEGFETAKSTTSKHAGDSVAESFADFDLTDFYAGNAAWLTDLLSAEFEIFVEEQGRDEDFGDEASDEFADSATSSEDQPERLRPKSTISRLDYGSATAELPVLLSHSPPERPEIVGIWERLKFDSNPRGPPRSDHVPASEFARLTSGAQQLQQLRYSIAPRGPSSASAL